MESGYKLGSEFKRIQFKCPHCGCQSAVKKYSAAVIYCPSCRKAVMVPGGRELALSPPDRADTARVPAKVILCTLFCAALTAAFVVFALRDSEPMLFLPAAFMLCGCVFPLRGSLKSYPERTAEIEKATADSRERLSIPSYAQLLRQYGISVDDSYVADYKFSSKSSAYDTLLRQGSSGNDRTVLDAYIAKTKNYSLYIWLCAFMAFGHLSFLPAMLGDSFGLISELLSFAMCLAGLFTLLKIRRERTEFAAKAEKVLGLVADETLSLEGIGRETDLPYEKLIILLQDMFDAGLLEGSFVDVERGTLAVPYVTVYYVNCPHCGGNGPKTFRKKGHCEYCGGEL